MLCYRGSEVSNFRGIYGRGQTFCLLFGVDRILRNLDSVEDLHSSSIALSEWFAAQDYMEPCF